MKDQDIRNRIIEELTKNKHATTRELEKAIGANSPAAIGYHMKKLRASGKITRVRAHHIVNED